MKTSLLFLPLFVLPATTFGAEKEAATLPLRDVALFSSGVGYFGRSGQVSGDASVPLRVKAPQIADVLKSLVIFDAKGTIRPATYSLSDWIDNRPRETDLNLGASFTPGAVLRAFQGANVRLEKPSGAIEGRILSVSETQKKDGQSSQIFESVTLLTASGVQTVKLDDLNSFRLLDPLLDAKLRASLEKKAGLLTSQLDDGQRTVSLHFEGKGAREVSAAYLLETPVWKTSYRLVLDAKNKPYLQGWAIVENASDEDWNGVHLSLISGRPISFIQDLATPVYLSRPVVPPQIIGSPRPQTFGEGFQPPGEKAEENRLDASEPRDMALENRVTPPPRLTISPSIQHQTGVGNYLDATEGRGFLSAARSGVAQGLLYDKELQAQAQGEQRGELFEYAIDGATTIGRGQAAMVPIISASIDGDAVTIVESSLQQGEMAASNGFRLRNSTGLNLQGGPITVYSGGIYAGDALTSNLVPKDSRLIAYALDLDLSVKQDEPKSIDTITKISFSDGILQIQRSVSQTRIWSFKNKAASAKSVLLQVPDQGGWKLSDEKQLNEKTADAQRFRFEVKPGESRTQIKWQQETTQTIAVFDANADEIGFYIDEKSASPALKAKLGEFLAQKRKLSELQRQRATQENALKDIEADQARIRANMEPLDKTGALFKSYERKLGAQEDKIERVRAEIERLRSAENSEKIALRAALSGLDLE